MSATASSDDIRRMIDEALEEIERTELEMLDMLADLLGPGSTKLVADQIAAQRDAPRFQRLLESRSGVQSRESTPERPSDGTGVT